MYMDELKKNNPKLQYLTFEWIWEKYLEGLLLAIVIPILAAGLIAFDPDTPEKVNIGSERGIFLGLISLQRHFTAIIDNDALSMLTI